MNFKTPPLLGHTPPILEIPAHQVWHRVQRKNGRGDSVRLKGYVLAPPGGRMPKNLLAIARECGYTHVLSSEPGVLAAAEGAARPLPRMAMTAATRHVTFQRWIRRDHVAIGHERLRYRGLALAKRMLGDTGYERVRAGALGVLGRRA